MASSGWYTRVRAEKRTIVSADHGSHRYRGGQVRAVDGDLVTVRVHLEAHLLGDRTCSAALFDAIGGAAVGNPCVVDLRDDAIVAVVAAPPADHGAEAAYRQDGETFSPGRIPRSLIDEREFY